MTTNEHRKPLAPGEIRRHTVGEATFQVMHVAGGSFTQATVRTPGQPTSVLCTDTNTAVAVKAYADAVEAAEQAESDRIDALDDADATAFIGASSGRLVEPITPTPQVIAAEPGVQVECEDDPYAEREASVPYNLNVLRGLLYAAGDRLSAKERVACFTAIEKIDAKLPVRRAADLDGDWYWQHTCGAVRYGDGDRQPETCSRSSCFLPGTWRPLYTLGGGRA